MFNALNYRSWPLRGKFAALLIAASILPSVLTAYITIVELRDRRMLDTQRLLIARAEQLSHELDSIHTGYLNSLKRTALHPRILEYCQADGRPNPELDGRIAATLGVFPKSDARIQGMALISRSGTIKIATDATTLGEDVSRRTTIGNALSGSTLISDIYVSVRNGKEVPRLAYLTPVFTTDKKVACVLAMWVDAESVWSVLREAHGKAGASSFAVLYDTSGIRVGHSFRDDVLYRAGGELDPSLASMFIATARFGSRTAEYLHDVRPFREQFEGARAKELLKEVFRGYATANKTWNYGVGSRMITVPWTVFYMMPEAPLMAEISAASRDHLLMFIAAALFAVVVGIVFASTIARPIRELRAATLALASGDGDARVAFRSSDEVGQLAMNFNVMASKIQAQAAHLQRSNNELKTYADKLERANRDLETFAFSVSHDLRSPLSVASGFASILQTKYAHLLDEKGLHYLTRISAGHKQMGLLIDGILRLSQLGRQPLVKAPVDIDTLVQQVLDELRQAGALECHELSVGLDLGEVFADGVLLRQVFMNLLSNAAKFSAKAAHPHITITSASAGTDRIFTIEDNGAGFDAAHATHLFEPFNRLHRVEEFQGLGIGLSIAQRIIQRHGGRIWAVAAVNEGATFSFSLPTRTSESGSTPAAGAGNAAG